jgi:hypothetical protein
MSIFSYITIISLLYYNKKLLKYIILESNNFENDLMRKQYKQNFFKIFDLKKLKELGQKLGIITQEKKILLQQLYCQNGHPLINPKNPKFDHKPGIELICEGEKYRQTVYLSPFQGDSRKLFQKDYQKGEELFLFCPVCECRLPEISSHSCQFNAKYVALFLDQNADIKNSVCICNIWGCYDSRINLSGKLITEVTSKSNTP